MSELDFSITPGSGPEEASETEGAVQYLLAALADRQYGFRLDTLQEVLRFQPEAVAPLPNAPEWLEGVFSLRGTIISVVNLRLFLGMPPATPAESDSLKSLALFGIGAPVPRLLVLHSEGVVVGVIVDDLKGVLFVQPDQIKPTLPETGLATTYLAGYYLDARSGQTTLLLDTPALVTSPEMLVFEPIY